MYQIKKGKIMNLKTATLITLIGIAIQTVLYLLFYMNILEWSRSFSILSLIIGNGSLLFFLGTLYLKQK